MKTRLTDMSVTITNQGSGSSIWEINIAAFSCRLTREHDYVWKLESHQGGGCFKELLLFTQRDTMKALNRGITNAFIAAGVLA